MAIHGTAPAPAPGFCGSRGRSHRQARDAKGEAPRRARKEPIAQKQILPRLLAALTWVGRRGDLGAPRLHAGLCGSGLPLLPRLRCRLSGRGNLRPARPCSGLPGVWALFGLIAGLGSRLSGLRPRRNLGTRPGLARLRAWFNLSCCRIRSATVLDVLRPTDRRKRYDGREHDTAEPSSHWTLRSRWGANVNGSVKFRLCRRLTTSHSIRWPFVPTVGRPGRSNSAHQPFFKPPDFVMHPAMDKFYDPAHWHRASLKRARSGSMKDPVARRAMLNIAAGHDHASRKRRTSSRAQWLTRRGRAKLIPGASLEVLGPSALN